MTWSNHTTPVLWLLTALLGVSMLLACNDSKPKTEGEKFNSSPAIPLDSPAQEVDSLPPLDPKATGKPEDGNTRS